MKLLYGTIAFLLFLPSFFAFAHSDSSDNYYTDVFTGISTERIIQVEAYNYNGRNVQLICFDLKSQEYRKCGTDDTEALHNIPIYYDLAAITDDNTFCYDRNNENYIRCTSLNKGHDLIHIPEGYELAAASDSSGTTIFYCRWKNNPEWTIDCDLANHNEAPDLNSTVKIPPGKVVAGVTQTHTDPSCDSNHRVDRHIYFIPLESYQQLKAALQKRWDDYKKAFPDGR